MERPKDALAAGLAFPVLVDADTAVCRLYDPAFHPGMCMNRNIYFIGARDGVVKSMGHYPPPDVSDEELERRVKELTG